MIFSIFLVLFILGVCMNYFMQLFLKFPAVLIALTFSGFGHALCAYLMGDKSQKYMGRLSISPSVHLDPIGFIFLLIAGFGWSKPVIVNRNSFKYKYAMAIYYLSGSITNMLTAVLFVWIIKILLLFNIGFDTLFLVLKFIVGVNVGYSAIQLIPIPPFSGYYFFKEILPYNIVRQIEPIERYSMIIFLLLVMTNATSYIIDPIYAVIYSIVLKLAGI